MQTYITLLKWTDQGIRNVKGTVERTEANRMAIEKAGGRLLDVYWTQGAYDLIAIGEFLDEESAMAMKLQVGIGGNARTETLRAFSKDDMQRIIQKLP